MSANRWSQARRLLCVRLDTLGDVLMTGPAMRALKESAPGRSLTLLTSAAGADAARLLPEIDEILVYEAPWMKATAARRTSRSDWEMAGRLRAAGFDGAVIFTVYSQSPLPAALLCYLAEIPLRLAHCRENPYHLLTDWIRETEPETSLRHEVRRQLDLVAEIGARTQDERLSVRMPPAALARIDALMADRVDDGRPWVVLHPGASAPSRRYPAERFAEVARRLIEELDCEIVWTGTEPESELVASIQHRVGRPTHSLVGLLDLALFAALLARAPLLISNNTGAVHLAAAVRTPVVDLYALTNPQHTPWQVPHRVLFHDVPCRYCYKSVCPEGHHDCLGRVEPETVVRAAGELLEQTAREVKGLRLVHPRY
ncbi:lipopolysaccharide heptosyltransferase II [Candidatus Nitrospira bockiana]